MQMGALQQTSLFHNLNLKPLMPRLPLVAVHGITQLQSEEISSVFNSVQDGSSMLYDILEFKLSVINT